jgi:16S rRNA (guanine527-N7)-methyltransferase
LDELRQLLHAGLEQMGIKIEPSVQEQLVRYLELLHKWNKTYNLTAVREPRLMVSRHLLDSLSIVSHIKGVRLMDIGSGAGLPGIPLALARPDIQCLLLDSNQKKTRFLVQTVASLGLENVEIIQNRIEKFQPDEKLDTLVSRAFASLRDFVLGTAHLSHPNIRWLAMKGRYPTEEIAELPDFVQVESITKLTVPDTEGERHIIVLTPDKSKT